MIAEYIIKNRIAVAVLCFVIAIAGVYAYSAMPRESAPDITIPYVFVSTDYPGVAPEDIENSITIPIEKKLKGLAKVKKITSSSTEGLSSIVIEFVTGTNIDEVLPKTKDKVDQAQGDLPNDLQDPPEVTEINISELPILTLSLSGDCGLVRLKEMAEDLQDDMETIPGVLEVVVTGGLQREIRVEPLAEKLAYYGLSIVQLQNVIAAENKNVSGGSIRMGDGRFKLRVPGEFRSPDEIYGLVIGTHQGRPVYLKNVARVVDGFKDEEGRSRLDGREAINLQVKKRTGENITRIAAGVDKIIESRQPTWPTGTKIDKLMDQSKDINNMVVDLQNNIYSGFFLLIIVLVFAMGLRNSIMVSLAVPFSALLTFMVLHAMGITLNMVVLFSLILALGMFVDDAIVIVENIYRYMEQGVPKLQAATLATAEVARPVTFSAVTTAIVFVPLLFWPGIMGEFMWYLPVTVILAVFTSLFVAMVINPALSAFFIRLPFGHAAVKVKLTPEEIQKAGEEPVAIRGTFLKTYKKLLQSALKHRTAVVIMAFLMVPAMAMLWLFTVGLEKPVEFFPNIDPHSVYVNIETPEGADLDYSDRITRQVESAICTGSSAAGNNPDPAQCYNSNPEKKRFILARGQEYQGIIDLPDVKHIYARSVARTGGSSVFEQNSPNHIGVQFHDFEDRLTTSPQTMEQIRNRIQAISGAKITMAKSEEGPPSGAPINIEIVGDNPQVLGQIAGKIKEELAKTPFVQDIRDNYVSGSPTVRVDVDRQKAAMSGLSTDVIGFALKVAFNGLKVSTFREANKDYDITIQLPESERRKTDLLKELQIPTQNGLVPLSTIAKFTITGGLGQINRINHERVVTVKADVNEQFIPGPVARAEAEKRLASFSLPSGYKTRFTGEFEMQQESQDFLEKAFVISLLLLYFVMVLQYNSVTQPLIIMTSVVFSLGGVFLGLSLMNQSFGVIMTGVGVISLLGIVVKNAIVLIDYINQLRERGFSVEEAVVAAGCTRLRPVLLTAITSILGFVPMLTGVNFDFTTMSLTFASESTQWWFSMASAVSFGLAFSTVLTLIVVPVLYSLDQSGTLALKRARKRLHDKYWGPFYRMTGIKPPQEEER
jgi:multidrug efflux pump subunit AcrB